jgi:bifunctional DNA-binding transcriptional regulator/antitoxin component of YhaV-PrlF toxin-antitoxin module
MTMKAHATSRAVSKIRRGRHEGLGLKEGDLVEVTKRRNNINIKPAKPFDPEDTLTAEEERMVAKGFGQLRRGEYVNWDRLKEGMCREIAVV